MGSRLVNLPTPFTIGAKRWELYFGHRFRGTINHEGDGHNLWGLDGGADVTLGVGYGLTRWLDISLQRARVEEDFEVALKASFGEKTPARRCRSPCASERTFSSARTCPTRAAHLPSSPSRVPSPSGSRVFVAPSWVQDTPRLRNAFNVPLGLSVRVRPDTRIEVEYVPENGDLEESVAAWHVGASKTVGGHIFKVFVGNSGATNVDQILGGDTVARFRTSDVRLGFNLVRYLPR